ncbi:hypothetical protein HDZ31DRAFT_70179, partial [Schizophyllum fasciatum]
TCKLVCLSRSEQADELYATPFVTAFPEEHAEERWATESVDWTQLKAPEPFCVASRFSNSDLLFVVQLEDGCVLYVALKFIFKNRYIAVSVDTIESTLANLNPERLFKVPCAHNNDGGVSLPLHSPVVGSPKPRVLRAFATFPDATDIHLLRSDASSHPRAALKVDALQSLAEMIPFRSIIMRVYVALIERRKHRIFGDESIQLRAEGATSDEETDDDSNSSDEDLAWLSTSSEDAGLEESE